MRASERVIEMGGEAMNAEIYLVIIILAFAALYFTAPYIIGTYLRYRGTMVITCPETRKPAAVEVDASHAALTAAIFEPDLRLKNCTRWPEKKDCGQECLLQIEVAPEDCLANNMLKRWYEGKACVFCAKQFGEIRLTDHKPALLNAEGRTVEWREFRPETLPQVLETHRPVCWDCHMLKTLIREHPGLVFEGAGRAFHVASK
jgi:hypothetical protein